MLLSRVELAPGATTRDAFWRQVRSGYAVHQLVWRWFAGEPEGARDFLYRYEQQEGAGRFYVLSARAPRSDDGLWRIESKPFAPRLVEGQRLRFSLRANPSLRRGGKRHDVVMDAIWKKRMAGARDTRSVELRDIEGPCVQWLLRQGARCGFAVDETRVTVEGYRQERFGHRGKRDIRLSTVDFEGELIVRQPEVLTAAVQKGIGAARGFGCGLMLIKRA